MTGIGIITAAIALLMLVWAPRRLWELAILTTPFQASTLVELSGSSRESGLAPVYLVLVLACLYELWHWLPRGIVPRALVRLFLPAICFLGWGILTAVAIPACFQGWLLVAPYSIYTLSRLEPSFSNMTHCLYLTLLLSAMVLLALHVHRQGLERVRTLQRAYEAAVWVSAGMIVWHHLSLYLGVPYPSDFLYNHPGVVHYEGNALRPELALASGLLRASGPFSEASIAAAYLAGGFGLTVADWVHRRGTMALCKCALLGAVMLSTFSTSSVVLVSATLLFYLAASAGSGEWRQVAGRLLLLFLALSAVPLSILMVSPPARDEAELAVNYLVLNKFDTTTDASSRSRTVIEQNALVVFENSYGLGAGLGSNIAFTAQGYIASSTGLLGLGLYAWFAHRVWNAYRERVRQGAEGSTVGMDLRRLGGAMGALILGGIVGSHPLLFSPASYLVLGTIIAASCFPPLQPWPTPDHSPLLQPEFLEQT